MHFSPLIAQDSAAGAVAATQQRVLYTLARLDDFAAAWQYVALAVLSGLLAAFVIWMYRRESVDLPRGASALLALLRLAALATLLIYFLQPERRTEQRVVQNSKVLLLVDTSLSMGLDDATVLESPPAVRLSQVVEALERRGLIRSLREKHDVALMRFDAELTRLAMFGRLPSPGANSAAAGQSAESADSTASTTEVPTDWTAKLVASGPETRIGQALSQAIQEARTAPLSGVVLFTDGGNNGGLEPDAAIQAAREAKVPVFPVGVGSTQRPANARIADVNAPPRAFLGADAFQVTGYIQAHGLAGRTASVELESRAADEPVSSNQLEGSTSVVLSGDSEPVVVRFDVSPKIKGRRVFQLRLSALTEDGDASDNQQTAEVEIVDHKTKVLLLAGGPTREFIFVRNLLYRDQEVISDVLLQTPAKLPGSSQEARVMLDAFPATAAEIYEYDCLVAFDADWRQLAAEQIDLLENWVAEKAGGLVLVAGPVQTDHVAQDERLTKVRALFPVEFHRRLTSLGDAKFGSEVAWPLEFTREGAEAEFLWIGPDATESRAAWAALRGVFGYFDVKRAKDAATVYARYANAEAASGGELPVYMAGQFYGSGKVFYLGSGEMWRLRGVDERLFEQFYTKLVRHVSQGRLLAGSNRGMLLADQDRYLQGATMIIRARLTDARYEPLDQPSVVAQVVRPSGASETISLAAERDRKGLFVGQLTAIEEGTYHFEVAMPDDAEQRLSRRVQVRAPRLERENPERNDPLLAEIALGTGGKYYVGAAATFGEPGLPPLADLLPDRTKTTELPPIKDMEFDRLWSQWFLGLVAGLLSTEWLLRRLLKLA